jgi:hypothetical protein
VEGKFYEVRLYGVLRSWPGSESLPLWTELPFLRNMGAYVEERTTHCPRCGESATRIVRGRPDPEYLQDLERAGIDYELGGLMAFEESSDWRCRSCGYEWRDDESSILG